MAETPNEQQDMQNLAPEDDFDAAFDEFAAEGGGNEEPAETETHAEPEPEQQEEQKPAEQPQNEPEPDDWQHKYDSMMGRFKAAQNENKELRDRLTALEEAEKKRQQEKAQDAEPDEEKPDLEGIAEEYRPLFEEKSDDGRKMRKMLEDFGPEYAQNFAETVKIKRELADAKTQYKRQSDEERMQKHRDALAAAAPEFADAIQGRDQQGWNDLLNGVNAWIDTLPYSEGKRMAQVVQSGTTEQVADMLGRYSRYRKGPTKDAVRNLAKSNLAVPRTGGVPPSTQASADDFDAAWEEAARQ